MNPLTLIREALDRRKCRIEGHLRPYFVWYDSARKNNSYCERCGVPVTPNIDWSGHP